LAYTEAARPTVITAVLLGGVEERAELEVGGRVDQLLGLGDLAIVVLAESAVRLVTFGVGGVDRAWLLGEGSAVGLGRPHEFFLTEEVDSETFVWRFELNEQLIVTRHQVGTIPAAGVSSICRVDEERFAVVLGADQRVVLWEVRSGRLHGVASMGRGGRGFVREPGPVVPFRGGFAVNDRRNYLIQRFSVEGEFLEQYGGKGATIEKLDLAHQLSESAGKLVISDTNNDRVLLLDTFSAPAEILVERTYCPTRLSRPTSVAHVPDVGLVVVDRGNCRVVAVDDESLAPRPDLFELALKDRVPTAVAIVPVSGTALLAVLTRAGRLSRPSLSLYDLRSLERVAVLSNDLQDPQGMAVVEDHLIVVDGVSRRALRVTPNLDVESIIELDALSGIEDFLCRYPSLVGNEVYFFHTLSGDALVTGPDLVPRRVEHFDLRTLGISSVRRVVSWDDNLILVLGTGSPGAALLRSDFSPHEVAWSPEILSALAALRSPSDAITSPDGSLVLVEKESDRLVRLTQPSFWLGQDK
jgi:hypothetical protein